MYIIEFGRGRDRRRRKNKTPSLTASAKRKVFATSIARDLVTGFGVSALNSGLSYALVRKRGLKHASALKIAKKNFKHSIPYTVAGSVATGTYSGARKIYSDYKNNLQ